MEKGPIKSFRDLIVYQETYDLSLKVAEEVLANLPSRERYDLVDQLSRSSKAIPRLIAEGYAKKRQKRGFNKYLDDALAECNETIVSLEQCRDIYKLSPILINQLVAGYDKSGRQIFRLSEKWQYFGRKDMPNNQTKPLG